jgi:hypothetical protein
MSAAGVETGEGDLCFGRYSSVNVISEALTASACWKRYLEQKGLWVGMLGHTVLEERKLCSTLAGNVGYSVAPLPRARRD